MPQIIVTAGDAADLTEGTVTLRERINASDFESDRFAANLVERLGWAVSDAAEVERTDCAWEEAHRHPEEARRHPEKAHSHPEQQERHGALIEA